MGKTRDKHRRLGLGKPKLTASTVANILVVAAIIFIPLMYGGILSSAYQDPVERIDHIRAAVVNEDAPYRATLISGQTETVDVGEMLTEALTSPEDGEDTGFKWTEMTRDHADAEMADGSIRAVLYIPADLSEEVAQIGTDNASNVVPSRLELVTDDGINYLAGTLARSVAATLQDRVTSEASSIYAEALLAALEEVRVGMGDAANGAKQLAEGSGTLSDGLHQLDEGAAAAATGSGDLRDGAGQLADGLSQMASQIPELERGVGALADGTGALSRGASTLSYGVDQYAGGVEQVAVGAHTLRSQTPELQQGLADLQIGTSQLAAGSAQLSEEFKAISEPVEQLAPIPEEIRAIASEVGNAARHLQQQCEEDLGTNHELCQLLERLTEHQTNIEQKVNDITGKADEAIGGIAAAQNAMGDISDGSKAVDEGVAALSSSIGTTSDTANNKTVLGAVNAIDDGLSALAGNSEALRSGSRELASGANQVASGVGQLESNVPALVAGANQLNVGGTQVAAGAADLNDGLSSLAEGMSEASSGGSALVEGSAQLEAGLEEGVELLPNYAPDERQQIAETSSTLVQVDPVRENAVNNAGAGFSPMFISLALWIGGIAIYLVLPALDRRPGPSETWWMAAVRPARTAGVFAVLQAVTAIVFTNWLVELHAVDLWGLIGIAVLASLTFVAVNQACIAILGYRGRFVSIVLLLLQIASMGATFPVETMPAFFNWIHPWLPMTYTQLSFRAMIAGGGSPLIVFNTVLVLLVWLLVSVSLVLFGAYSRTKNHPLPYDAALLPDNYPEEDQVSPKALAERKDLKKQIVEHQRERLVERGIIAGHRGTMGTVGPRTTTVTMEAAANDEDPHLS